MTDIYMNLSRIVSKINDLDIGNVIVERHPDRDTIMICIPYDHTCVVEIIHKRIDNIGISALSCPIIYQWAGLGVIVVDDMKDDLEENLYVWRN